MDLGARQDGVYHGLLVVTITMQQLSLLYNACSLKARGQERHVHFRKVAGFKTGA